MALLGTLTKKEETTVNKKISIQIELRPGKRTKAKAE